MEILYPAGVWAAVLVCLSVFGAHALRMRTEKNWQAQAVITRDMADFVRIGRQYKIDGETFLKLMGLSAAGPASRLDTFRATASAFDGMFGGLIDCYQVHPQSPFHDLKHSVRVNYIRS